MDAPESTRRAPRRRRRARVIALTGVHGMPGAALLRRLEDDDSVERVVLLDRHGPALPLRKAVMCLVDLTATLADGVVAEALARERVETVIHTAFHAAPVRNLEAAHELEVIGTRALLHAIAHDARHAGTVTNLVVLGTTMSYGARPDNAQYLDEDAPLRGAADYAFVTDKMAVEAEVAAFRRRTGMPAAILRACWTLGVPDTIAARGLALPLVPTALGSDPLVQLLHLEDLVDAVRLACHGRHDGAFNVAGDGVLPLSTVIKLAGRLCAPMPDLALRRTLQGLWITGLGLVPGAHAPYLRDTFVADGAHAASVLGFHPRYSTRETLAWHVAARRTGRLAA